MRSMRFNSLGSIKQCVGQPGNMRVPVRIMYLQASEILDADAYVKSREIAAPIHSRYLSEYQFDPRFVVP
jgi:gamma-glutamylaminecyclotransferase